MEMEQQRFWKKEKILGVLFPQHLQRMFGLSTSLLIAQKSKENIIVHHWLAT